MFVVALLQFQLAPSRRSPPPSPARPLHRGTPRKQLPPPGSLLRLHKVSPPQLPSLSLTQVDPACVSPPRSRMRSLSSASGLSVASPVDASPMQPTPQLPLGAASASAGVFASLETPIDNEGGGHLSRLSIGRPSSARSAVASSPAASVTGGKAAKAAASFGGVPNTTGLVAHVALKPYSESAAGDASLVGGHRLMKGSLMDAPSSLQRRLNFASTSSSPAWSPSSHASTRGSLGVGDAAMKSGQGLLHSRPQASPMSMPPNRKVFTFGEDSTRPSTSVLPTQQQDAASSCAAAPAASGGDTNSSAGRSTSPATVDGAARSTDDARPGSDDTVDVDDDSDMSSVNNEVNPLDRGATRSGGSSDGADCTSPCTPPTSPRAAARAPPSAPRAPGSGDLLLSRAVRRHLNLGRDGDGDVGMGDEELGLSESDLDTLSTDSPSWALRSEHGDDASSDAAKGAGGSGTRVPRDLTGASPAPLAGTKRARPASACGVDGMDSAAVAGGGSARVMPSPMPRDAFRWSPSNSMMGDADDDGDVPQFGAVVQTFGMQGPLARSRTPACGYFDSEFEVAGIIAKGSFGNVYKCLNRLDGIQYAVKKSRKQYRNDSERQHMLQEVFAMAAACEQSSCPHLLRYYHAWEEDHHLFIQTELCDFSAEDMMPTADERERAGLPSPREDDDMPPPPRRSPSAGGDSVPRAAISLTSVVRRGRMPQQLVVKFLRHTLRALCALHDANIVHLDVKPANVLYRHGVFKLGDLGLANRADQVAGDVEEGDARYLPMELLQGHTAHLPASDIFSLGASIYELARGVPLASRGPEWRALRETGIEPHMLPHLSTPLVELIHSMVAREASARPSAGELLRSPLLATRMEAMLREERKRSQLYLAQITHLRRVLATVAQHANVPLSALTDAGGARDGQLLSPGTVQALAGLGSPTAGAGTGGFVPTASSPRTRSRTRSRSRSRSGSGASSHMQLAPATLTNVGSALSPPALARSVSANAVVGSTAARPPLNIRLPTPTGDDMPFAFSAFRSTSTPSGRGMEPATPAPVTPHMWAGSPSPTAFSTGGPQFISSRMPSPQTMCASRLAAVAEQAPVEPVPMLGSLHQPSARSAVADVGFGIASFGGSGGAGAMPRVLRGDHRGGSGGGGSFGSTRSAPAVPRPRSNGTAGSSSSTTTTGGGIAATVDAAGEHSRRSRVTAGFLRPAPRRLNLSAGGGHGSGGGGGGEAAAGSGGGRSSTPQSGHGTPDRPAHPGLQRGMSV